jgi:hypothetical protein
MVRVSPTAIVLDVSGFEVLGVIATLCGSSAAYVAMGVNSPS